MKSILSYLSAVKIYAEKNKFDYAIAGALAINLYRSDIRFTNDVDVVISADQGFEDLVLSLGLKPNPIKLAYLSDAPSMHKNNSPVAMVLGTSETKSDLRLDLILPSMPWANVAIQRAANNLRDFGCGAIPVLSLEDLIIAKLYSVSMRRRAKDIDDLENVFINNKIDLLYLCEKIEEFKLILPIELYSAAPKALRIQAKRLKRCS